MITNNQIEDDKQQRQLALDPRQSFIVQAPAGSGKTELLIQRFLTLLNHVNAPEEILAITFTKKAANEMRSRIIKALKHAMIEPEPDSAHMKQTWRLAKAVLQRDEKLKWHLIDNPNQMRIQTIDSLCSYLTKQLPLLSHFGSQPALTEDARFLYEKAVQEVLSHIEHDFEWSSALSTLLLHLDNDLNKLHDLLVHLLSKRDQWLPYIQLNTSDKNIRQQLESHLAHVITDSLINVRAAFPAVMADEFLFILRYAGSQMALNDPESDVAACRDLTALPGCKPADKKAWLGVRNFLLTEKGEWRKAFKATNGLPAASNFKNPQEKSQAADFQERIKALMPRLHCYENLRNALSSLIYLPESCYDDQQWETLKALLHVLKIVAAQLRLTFQQHGQIDFIETSQAALTSLGSDDSPTDLALALDYQIRHILVDEFQDTSLTQHQLLEKLTTGWDGQDGRTLFVVGDPMQSIYRFREAEVGLFIRMRERGIGGIQLSPITLSVNFRSTATIVEWNNQHFKQIFPPFNEVATGAVTYSSSISNKLNDQSDSTHVLIHGYADSSDAIQGQAIVHLIQDTRKHSPSDTIAILVRSRPHLDDIIPALKKANIPFRAIDIDPLESRQHIQDLLSLACAMLHPADRIAWLAVLRAPWCGLKLADLLVIAGDHPHAAIFEQIKREDILKRLSSDGQSRIEKIRTILGKKIAERARADLRSWIENTWLLLGGPATLKHASQLHDAHAFFNLLQSLNEQSPFVDSDALKYHIKKLYAAAQHDDAALQIMTVHSAKGLEFDTVIIPHLERKPANDKNSLLLWMERPLSNDKVALLLAPMHATGDEKDNISTYVTRQQSLKADYEIERLFYVAATRAKKRLHLLFSVDTDIKGHYRVHHGSFLKKLWPLIDANKHNIITKKNESIETTAPESPVRWITRLSHHWHNPVIRVDRASTPSYHQQTGFTLSDQTPRAIGIVIHRILQTLAQYGIDWWTKQPDKNKIEFISLHLKQHDVTSDKSFYAAQMVKNAINNTLNDERGVWILSAHQDAKSEYPLSAVIDGSIQHFVIDRMFVDNEGTRWIIDYKSTALTKQDLQDFLENEQEKYREKMQKYAQALQLIENIPVRLGLYFPALPAWKEWR